MTATNFDTETNVIEYFCLHLSQLEENGSPIESNTKQPGYPVVVRIASTFLVTTLLKLD